MKEPSVTEILKYKYDATMIDLSICPMQKIERYMWVTGSTTIFAKIEQYECSAIR